MAHKGYVTWVGVGEVDRESFSNEEPSGRTWEADADVGGRMGKAV